MCGTNDNMVLNEETVTFEDDIGAGVGSKRSTTSDTASRTGGTNENKLGMEFDYSVLIEALELLRAIALALFDAAVFLALGFTLNFVADFATVR